MSNCLYDIRFAFKHDNPFPNDTNKEHLKELKKYLASNQDKFTEVDYLNDSRFLIICPETTQLFGENVVDNKTGYAKTDTSANIISNHVKDFILSVNGISNEMRAWASKKTAVNPQASIDNQTTKDDDKNDDNDDSKDDDKIDDKNDASYEDYIQMVPTNYTYNSTVTITNYDISTDKCITYEDLRKLTINIARSKLIPVVAGDETVAALEQEKKKKLIQQITRYRNVKVIAMMDDSDLNAMTLSQLETCLDQCVKYHENFKTIELFKRGFGCGGVIYDMVFPEGIPISKTKRLCFKGVGKEILSTLFDPHTPVGLAFSNILQKHNIHVSDELLTLVAFAGICVSKVKVETVKPTDDVDIDNIDLNNNPRKINTNKSINYNGEDYYESDLEDVSDET